MPILNRQLFSCHKCGAPIVNATKLASKRSACLECGVSFRPPAKSETSPIKMHSDVAYAKGWQRRNVCWGGNPLWDAL